MMSLSDVGPKYIGFRTLIPDDEDSDIDSFQVVFTYKRVKFAVLVSAEKKDFPASYIFDQSIEAKFIDKIHNLMWFTEDTEEQKKEMDQLQSEFARLGGYASLPLMQETVPGNAQPDDPPPEAGTLQEYLYPETHFFQVLTEKDKLKCHRIDEDRVSALHPSIPEARLREMGLGGASVFPVPTVKPAQIVLRRRLQSLTWIVDVDGEQMICKASYYIFEHAVGDELERYLKIARAADHFQMRLPQLKGIVQSHKGVVGLLLNYVPHKYRSLRMMLDSVKTGEVPEADVSPELRAKWAVQIKETVGQLHKLGIFWGDIKTDNVEIDDNSDAIVLDFGGGNTAGWVDQDKFGTVEGELQGLQKIMVALGQE